MGLEEQLRSCQYVQTLRWDGVDILLIHRPECQASISLLGAQLLSYQPQDQMPVLWQNPSADFSGNAAIRSGIPICWPWFNAISMNADQVQASFADVEHPSHGTVRDRIWQLVSVEELNESTEIKLATSYAAKSLRLEVTYSLGTEFHMTLTTTNEGDTQVAFSSALHSYFAVSDITEVAVTGLEGCQYIDMIDAMKEKQQEGYVQVDQEVDRMYFGVRQPVKLLDAGWQRQVLLEANNSTSAIVWNPWIDKCQRTSQLLDNDYRSFICIETANAGKDFVTLDASESHQLKLNIRSRSL